MVLFKVAGMLPQRIQTKWSVSILAPTSGLRKHLCQRGGTALEWRWWAVRSTCVVERRAGTGKLIRKYLLNWYQYIGPVLLIILIVSNKMFIGTVF